MKRFRRGLVVGKFAPLHLGHVHLITRAQEECDELVIVSYSSPEFGLAPPEARSRWLRKLYPRARSFVLTQEGLANECLQLRLPPNSATDSEQREFLSLVYRHFVNAPLDALFTSEDYGPGAAEHLASNLAAWKIQEHPVTHVSVDRERRRVPVSGTLAREDIHGMRTFLPKEVYADFVKRVVFLGGESTGKSTMTLRLARELETAHVDEYGRTLWERKNGCLQFEDFLEIARVHVQNEDAAMHTAREFVFIDTSPLTTLFYCLESHGRADPALEALAARPYDHVFLCAPDFPFVQDGTRVGEEFRDRQHRWYLETLKARGVAYQLLTGSIEERVLAVRRHIRS
jgi:NadR type nicotinamide-nucleotide adenylyltransferase